MSQGDYSISNGSGATVRADMNSMLEVIASNNSGPTAPSVTFPNMWWFDETNDLMKQRDSSNLSWITVARKDGDGWTPYLQGTPLDEIVGDNLLAANNTWTGTNEFDAASTFDGAATFNSTVTFAGSNIIQCSDRQLARPYLLDYAETVNARGSITGAQTIDLTLGNVVTATLTGNTTFTFSNPPASGRAGSFTLILTNPSTRPTWPASVTWPEGVEPTLTASGVDILVFFTINGGTTWRGNLVGLDYS